MGGQALKSIATHRLNAHDYHALVPQVLKIIRRVVGENRPLCVIDAYRAKQDFGDMDVLVASDELPADYKDVLEREFESREVYRNGNVTSFDFGGFQIDLIAIANDKFDYAKSYFSWNDLGNLVGRIAHKMGLKHGFEGLCLPMRAGDTHVFCEISVTLDIEQALTFMGYDPLRYRQGFDTLEDIFRFTASTPYFNPAIYLLENRNAHSRVRDAKRKTYSAFLQWLDDPAGLRAFVKEHPEIKGDYQFPADKSVWIAPLRAAFSQLGEQMDEALSRKARGDRAKALFNGEHVARLTGLSGKPLGHLMGELRNRHPGQDAWVEWVLSAGQAGVDAAVRQAAHALPDAPVSFTVPRP